jgi:hypothetical protein
MMGGKVYLLELIEKVILEHNHNITRTEMAGMYEAKTIVQEVVAVPILMPDFFTLAF